MRQTAMAALLGSAAALLLVSAAAANTVVWVPAPQLAPVGLYGQMAAGDLDGDGDDDIADFCYLRAYWNAGGCPGPVVWQVQEGLFPNLGSCRENSGTWGDVDADGDLDLVYACIECPSFRVIWNVGSPQAPVWEYGGAIPGDSWDFHYGKAYLCEIDADGDLDIMGTSGGLDVNIWENTGTPAAPYWTYLGVVPNVRIDTVDGSLSHGDLDGDGDLDIVGGNGTSRVKCWENVGTPQVWSYVRNDAMLTGVTAPMDGTWGVALPDVDCDGDPDLVVAGWTSVYLYLNERITPVQPGSWGMIKALYRP